MSVVELAEIPNEKTASRAAWRYLRRPLLGIERAAPGAERRLGQMSQKTENWVANEAAQSGMSRETHNTILKKWWDKNRELVDDYAATRPDAAPFMQASPDKLTTFEQFQQGVGKYKGRGTLKSRMDAQRRKDLKDSYSAFGKDQNEMYRLQRNIDRYKSLDSSAKPYALAGAVGGAGTGYYSEGDLQGALMGAAAGATIGLGGGKAIARLSRDPRASEGIKALRAQQAEIAARHGKGLIGARAKYMARRVTDPLVERGRYANAGERLRFGRLGGGHVFGRGYELIKARAAQGGLLGKGGLIRGGIAMDPRIGMNYRLMRHAMSQGQYGQAARLGKDLAIGSTIQAGKFGLMGGLPAYSIYSEMTDPSMQQSGSFLGRLGRSAGANLGGVATFPMGMLTWAPSMIPGLESASLGHQIGNVAGAAGEYLSPSQQAVSVPDVRRTRRGAMAGTLPGS